MLHHHSRVVATETAWLAKPYVLIGSLFKQFAEPQLTIMHYMGVGTLFKVGIFEVP